MNLTFNLFFLLLLNSFSTFAEEPSWLWVEVDLTTSTLIGKGEASLIQVNDSRTMELSDKNKVRRHLFSCDIKSEPPTCVNEYNFGFSVSYNHFTPSPAIIDLDTGTISGSIETYILLKKNRLISISKVIPAN